MSDPSSQSLLEELDARQDALLQELELLNQRLEQVIRESATLRGPGEEQPRLSAA
jgi:hypothetical protein